MIPTSTTSGDTCNPKCGMFKTCYAKGNPLGLGGHWNKVTAGSRGSNLDQFCEQVQSLPEGTVWRHNQAGDLPGKGRKISRKQMIKLVKANKGRRGFTFCHKDMEDASNQELVRWSNQAGFTINLSADNLTMADKLADLEIGPVATVVPSYQTSNTKTPAGRLVVICPADHVTGKDRGINCGTCKLCSLADRKVIIGFPAHGTWKKKIDATFVPLSQVTHG